MLGRPPLSMKGHGGGQSEVSAKIDGGTAGKALEPAAGGDHKHRRNDANRVVEAERLITCTATVTRGWRLHRHRQPRPWAQGHGNNDRTVITCFVGFTDVLINYGWMCLRAQAGS